MLGEGCFLPLLRLRPTTFPVELAISQILVWGSCFLCLTTLLQLLRPHIQKHSNTETHRETHTDTESTQRAHREMQIERYSERGGIEKGAGRCTQGGAHKRDTHEKYKQRRTHILQCWRPEEHDELDVVPDFTSGPPSPEGLWQYQLSERETQPT